MAKQEKTDQGGGALEMLPGGRKVNALRGALEHSVTIQRARLQETVDDFVKRGKLSRSDADQLVRQVVTSGQAYSKALLQVLDSAVTDTRRGVESRVASVVGSAGMVVGKVRRSAPGGSATAAPGVSPAPAAADPIPGYADLTVPEIKPRLAELSADELHTVRDREQSGKARKGVLTEIERLLADR